MHFRILGPLEVENGGRSLAPSGRKPRALLALLLLHANEPVSPDRLIDELWSDEPPANAAKTLQIHISRLRKSLSADGAGGRLETVPAGYVLRVGDGELDRDRAAALLERGREELASGKPGTAGHTFREALSLFRGAPLADLAYEDFAQAEIARLVELRTQLLEARIEADLEEGRHADVLADLDRLVAEHPHREGPRALLMRALYRAGRHADALAVYQEYRRRLGDELGLEPGPELRRLERAILEHDPGLAPSAPPRAAATTRPVPERPWSSRRRAALPAAALVAALALAVGALALRPRGVAGVPARSLAVVDADSVRLTEAIALDAVPTDVVAARRAVYVAIPRRRTLVVVRPAAREPAAVGSAVSATRLAASGEAIWAVDGVGRKFARLRTDRVYALEPGEPRVDAVAADDDSVWLAERALSGITRFDVATGELRPIGIPGRGSFLEGDAERSVAVAGGSVWVTNPVTRYPQHERLGRVARLDAATGEVLARIPVPAPPLAIAADARAVWVALERGEQLWRIDPTDEVASAAVRVPGGVIDVAVDRRAVWALGREGAVSRIDPVRNVVVARAELGRAAIALAAGHGAVWVAVP
ncbi:MAG: winged helix-turn-helix domain-containing protein [Thermoleophilia bacterium]|nr:winged helix-turn-helix domain-containing protein [Thermoleophilia bacterium]